MKNAIRTHHVSDFPMAMGTEAETKRKLHAFPERPEHVDEGFPEARPISVILNKASNPLLKHNSLCEKTLQLQLGAQKNSKS